MSKDCVRCWTKISDDFLHYLILRYPNRTVEMVVCRACALAVEQEACGMRMQP